MFYKYKIEMMTFYIIFDELLILLFYFFKRCILSKECILFGKVWKGLFAKFSLVWRVATWWLISLLVDYRSLNMDWDDACGLWCLSIVLGDDPS